MTVVWAGTAVYPGASSQGTRQFSKSRAALDSGLDWEGGSVGHGAHAVLSRPQPLSLPTLPGVYCRTPQGRISGRLGQCGLKLHVPRSSQVLAKAIAVRVLYEVA